MLMALTPKNKIGFVNGSIPHPAASGLNSMVISWILNVVTREIANSLLYINTTYEI